MTNHRDKDSWFKEPTNIVEAIVAFRAGFMPWIEFPPTIIPFINAENVDDVVANLPEDLREFFVEYALDSWTVDYPPEELVSIGSNPFVPPRSSVLAVRDWLERTGKWRPHQRKEH